MLKKCIVCDLWPDDKLWRICQEALLLRCPLKRKETDQRKNLRTPANNKATAIIVDWQIMKPFLYLSHLHNWKPESKLARKHCQRHKGPEDWVYITESQLNIYFRISIQHQHLNWIWLNLASEYLPRFNFVTLTKHQQHNTDQTSARKSCLNFNFKILTKVLKVWTKVKLYHQTSASKSAINCCQHDSHH